MTVFEEMASGEQYAQRHRLALALRDGSRITRDVFVFASLDREGKFARIHEATVDVSEA